MSPTGPAADPRDIVTTRVLAHPREAVFAAWTDPAKVALWWGPRGFRNTFREFDARAGGHWHFVMHGPDGTDYTNHNVFVEVGAPARIVIDHVTQPVFRMTATFEAVDGGTRLLFHARFETPAIRDAVARYAIDANEQLLDRLDAVLSGRAPE